MKHLITTLFFALFLANQGAIAQDTAKAKIAILTATETTLGGFGSKVTLDIYYSDGKKVDGESLIKDFEKNKFLENFSSIAFLIEFLENQGYDMTSSSTGGIGQLFVYQYIFKRRE